MKKKIVAILTAMVLAVLSLFVFVGCAEGQDGKDFDLYSVYQQLVDRGEFEGTFAEFVQQYLDVEVNVDEKGTYSTAINSSLAQIVSIEVACDYRNGSGFMGTTQTFVGMGSGVIYQLDREKGDAYIITNCHVIYPSDTAVDDDGIVYNRISEPVYTAYLYGMEYADYAIPFEVVGYVMGQDIAVLKVEDSQVLKDSMAQAVTIGNSDEAAVGDSVFLIGNPLGYGIAATSGILSVENEQVAVYAADNATLLTLDAMRTDASANHGNSGGGLFDANGRLLGILFAGNNTDGTQGVNNVLPINRVKGIADAILASAQDGKTITSVKKAVMGIEVYTSDIRQDYDDQADKFTTMDTIVLSTVSDASASYGKLQAGDVIKGLKLGNYSIAVRHQWQIGDFLWHVRAGDKVSVTVERKDEDGETVRTVVEELTFTSGDFTTVA